MANPKKYLCVAYGRAPRFLSSACVDACVLALRHACILSVNLRPQAHMQFILREELVGDGGQRDCVTVFANLITYFWLESVFVSILLSVCPPFFNTVCCCYCLHGCVILRCGKINGFV